jgi:CheY-like chemotaxis protein
MDTALVTQWLKDGASLVAQLLNDHSRAIAALEETQRECGKLREGTAALREENDRLQKARSEVVDTIVAALSTATEALRQFAEAPAIVMATPVTAAGVLPAQADAGTAPPALASPPPPIVSPRPEERGGRAPRRVLVVDDDESFRSMVAAHLGGQGYEVTTAESGEKALRLLANSRPQVVLLDLRMPGMDGMQALQRIKDLYPDLCVLMVTGSDDRRAAQGALALGAADYVKKPFDLDYLDSVLAIYMTVHDAPQGAALSTIPAAEKSAAPTNSPTKTPFSPNSPTKAPFTRR